MATAEEVMMEPTVQPAQQNQDTVPHLLSCADDLHEKHQCSRYCDIIFRFLGSIGNVIIIIAFAFLFNEDNFKIADNLAIGGAAVSLLANIGKLLTERKRRHDNRKCIKNDVLPVVPVRRVALDEITLMALQSEESALSFLTTYGRCVCCRSVCCLCCCQEPCLRDDPLEPLCTMDPCRCLCCQCTCPCAPCPSCCQYLCSCLAFVPTFEFMESTFNFVYSVWVLCSNVRAISDRVQNKKSPTSFKQLSLGNKVLESLDVSFAIFSLLLSLVIIVWTCCCKCCRETNERPVVQIRNLSTELMQ
ncbi:uncharacterized protein LOC124272925 [Haliotis rubra]|uniref:uncharacterized protein LOC124272925 n=1 Tax=Haliotis rubra TaxID=36100 RepID=UPI001EE5F79D|nr:uncharacterized protein LOC124272925 [Haliotis rubra]